MKKVILILFSVFSVFTFAQQKNKEKKIPKDTLDKQLWRQELEKSKNDNAIGGNPFYKNVDSTKASKYKMLNKKPINQYSELQQTKRDTEIYKIEKPKDSIQLKKKKK
ncbi:hypothetical protein [Epilithonimonas hominis]|uniref:hypothetical protein n=1 Tax=Epilithonimonas hominis TaxID=420404 RepID=UPI00289B7221|nr:hypothetical protein [Epilithonimonas hominis]